LKVEKSKLNLGFESLGGNGIRVWHLGNMWVQELARGRLLNLRIHFKYKPTHVFEMDAQWVRI
jgi:hypothetical protein